MIQISPRSKEYLTVGQTIEELRSYEPQLRAAGFRKRRGANGRAKTTVGEYFQWWDRKTGEKSYTAQQNWQRRQRESGRCIICGKDAVASRRGGLSQYCDPHRQWYREYMRNYMRSRIGKPERLIE